MIIGNLDFYMPNFSKQVEGDKKVEEIVENAGLGITEFGCYDRVYGEHRFSGKRDGKLVYVTWNYFNGDIILKN